MMVFRWLLMAGNNATPVFSMETPPNDGLICRIIVIFYTYTINLGLFNQQTPPCVLTSVASAISTFLEHNIFMVDVGFDYSTNAFHWADVSQSTHNLLSLNLDETGKTVNPLHAELLGLSFLIEHLTSKSNSHTIILVECLAIVLYFIYID